MSTLLVFPVLWKDASTPCIQGSVDISVSELPRRRLEGSTVGDLIAALNNNPAFTNGSSMQRVDGILLYGTRLDHNRSLASAIVTMSAYCPRLVATVSSQHQPVPKMQIFVQPVGGSVLALSCSAADTVDDIKLKLQDRTGIPQGEQILAFGGKPLLEGRSLADYSVHSECTLQMTPRLRGGSTKARRFADVADDSLLREYAFAPGPLWRIAAIGLSVEGICETRSCIAFRQWVIHRIGFRSFNVRLDGDVQCPMCAGKVVARTCLFHDCMWKYEGVRADNHLLLSSPWKNALGSGYYCFDVTESRGIVAWESLLINVQSSEVSRAATLDGASRTLVNHQEMCSICWSQQLPRPGILGFLRGLRTKPAVTKISCGHRVHQACLKEWSRWCKRSHVLVSCPVCRAHLSNERTA